MPGLLLGEPFPNIEADTTIGRIKLYDFLGDKFPSFVALAIKRNLGGIDINSYNCDEPTETLPFPIIADPKRELAVQLGMLDPDEKDSQGMPVTARCVFIIGPDKKMKLSILYPATTGRNFDEILRVVDSLQLTAEHNVATPVDWKPGDRVMVPPNVPEAEAAKIFTCGIFTKELPSGKKYMRYTAQPH
uniref:Peroxiredoxin C-terminal domain-containing protein n=1 Tax=Pyxicephalus adspersus TaxID=30357 RepID=A0AAV3A1A9_PYXAD|nr:TPA: hypothetical protein GDO54_016397 [Pyxicephalus adspersus]